MDVNYCYQIAKYLEAEKNRKNEYEENENIGLIGKRCKNRLHGSVWTKNGTVFMHK